MVSNLDRIRTNESNVPDWARSTLAPQAAHLHGGADMTTREYRMIPRKLIERWGHNPRGIVKAETVAAFRDELLARRLRGEGLGGTGIEEYLKVRPNPRDAERYILIEGERRWKAVEGTAITELPVEVQTISEGDALLLAISLDKNRSDWGVLGECRAYLSYVEGINPDGKPKSVRDAARDFNISAGEIANRLRIVKPNSELAPDIAAAIVEDLQSMVGAREDSISHAEHIVKVLDRRARRRLIDRVVTGLSVAALKAEVLNIVQPIRQSTTAPPMLPMEPRAAEPQPAIQGEVPMVEYSAPLVPRADVTTHYNPPQMDADAIINATARQHQAARQWREQYASTRRDGMFTRDAIIEMRSNLQLAINELQGALRLLD